MKNKYFNACASKMKLRTREDAEVRARIKTIERERQQHVYKCTFCDGWHITGKLRIKSPESQITASSAGHGTQ